MRPINSCATLSSKLVDIDTLCEVCAVSIHLSHIVRKLVPPRRIVAYQQNLCNVFVTLQHHDLANLFSALVILM